MGDAEIIPIGTRGRPGRGTGTRPSAAARGLLGPQAADPAQRTTQPPAPHTTQRAAPRGAKRAADIEPDAEALEALARAEAIAEAEAQAETSSGTPDGAAPSADGTARRPAGIPAGDWLAALRQAADEMFGEQWEPQLARFLAFLRRRLTGDFVVDEYGFDPEIT